MEEILLNSAKGNYENNVDNYINLQIEQNTGILPSEEIEYNINEYETYHEERDASNRYRVLFTLNPMCSNVLFNNISEIIYHEGSDECIKINKGSTKINRISKDEKDKIDAFYTAYRGNTTNVLSRKELIDDTSLTHPLISDGFVYHCGYDIFNNHILRSKIFTSINKPNDGSKTQKFNTIFDSLRSKNGEKIITYLPTKGSFNKEYNSSLYMYDTTYTFYESVIQNLEEENGWIGFRNKTLLQSENLNFEIKNDGDEKKIIKGKLNKVLNNNKANEFIDLYPDRSLYAFEPKYNKYRNRYEYNWSYCLTYAFDNDYDNPLIKDGIICILNEIDNTSVNIDKEDDLINFRTIINNNFNVNDDVVFTLKYNDSNGDHIIYPSNTARVVTVGPDKTHFSVRISDILGQINEYILSNTTAITSYEEYDLSELHFTVNKVVNGHKCKYYIQKLRKLPNFKFTNVYNKETVSDYDIINNRNNGFDSTIGKLAFSKNIYGDNASQIIFNDDITVDGLVDNLGRKVNTIYLTIIKNNKGYKEWYERNDVNSSNIEYSHCFGKITAGYDVVNDYKDYNVHCIHNIPNNVSGTTDENGFINKSGDALNYNNGITINDEWFYGDIMEFQPATFSETILEPLYHRFNTYQRESLSDEYSTINSIVFDGDIYDGRDEQEYHIEEFGADINGNTNFSHINLNPEGYYYRAHYPIILKEYSNDIYENYDIELNFTLKRIYTTGITKTVIIRTNENSYLNVNDNVYLFYFPENRKINGIVIDTTGYTDMHSFYEYKIYFEEDVFELGGFDKITGNKIFKPNPLKTEDVYELNDGSGKYVWREFIKSANLTEENKTYDYIFTNGVNYIHNNINFYLRRQDPHGIYGLFNENFYTNPNFEDNNLLYIAGNSKDVRRYDFIETKDELC